MIKREYKREGNKVLWNNSGVWLIKETCDTEEEAQELLERLTVD